MSRFAVSIHFSLVCEKKTIKWEAGRHDVWMDDEKKQVQ